MPNPPHPAFVFLLALFSGWVNRHQQRVIEYLGEENRNLKRKVGRRMQDSPMGIALATQEPAGQLAASRSPSRHPSMEQAEQTAGHLGEPGKVQERCWPRQLALDHGVETLNRRHRFQAGSDA